MENEQDEQPKSEADGQAPQQPAQQVSRQGEAAPWRARHVCALRNGYGALSLCVPL
ncbi:hypothetical protein [Massilia sp. TWR1-2-2]|uniref:hypothetical protein n=1 Tax=Massilia sp. TWR1-2-2 TaxID=2804584 RepID=UPI003CF1CBAF